ncbi:MAG: PAS domain S-box protein, partial [Candidatus Tectomicrobia bacterium]|nr:PAS domain S-box protein [Candidatus Tectomicrobia bacterium]
SWPLLVLSLVLILTLGWNLYKANPASCADTGETVVAIAVDNTDKARALREINFLTKASELFNSSLDIDEVLNSIAKMTAGIIGDRCGIFLEVEGKDTLWPVALYSRLNESVEEIWNFILNPRYRRIYLKFVEDIARSGEPVLISDIPPEEEIREFFKGLSIRTYLAVPIKSKEKTLGVLVCASCRDTSRLGRRELEIAKQITDRAALAIENAQLFKNIEVLSKKKQALFEFASDPIFILDMEGKIIETNRASSESLGYTIKELIGKNIAEIKAPGYGERVPAVINRIKEKKQITFEHEHQRKSGSLFPVEISSRLIELPEGPVIQSITRDITDRRKVEEELRASLEFNKLFMDSLPFVALILRKNTKKILIANKTAGNIDIVPGKQCYSAWFKRETPCPWCRETAACETGKLQRLEFEDRNVVWESYWLPVGEDILLHYAFDITERRNLEKQLHQAQKMEAIGQLAGGIAHDFNNILSGITGYTTIMKMKMNDDHPFSQGLTVIEKSAWRAAELTKQLLGFARGGKYEIKQVNLNQVINNVLKIVGETFDKSIVIKTRLHEDICAVEGDPGQLEHVLLNLCLNARDAMPTGGTILIETKNIAITEAYINTHWEVKAGDYVLLTISDTGMGIPAEILGKIFEPFFTTKEIGRGTGMGLAMAYGIIKNHQGYIRVYSELGKGACFKIYLPVLKKPVPKRIEAKEDLIPKGSETILLVDDEEHIREIGKAFLEELGYKVILANDGKEACTIFAENPDIGLVLLDMNMPVMGGRETYLKLKELNSVVKVLLSSGYSINEPVREILGDGIRCFIEKPFSMKQLALSVRQTMDS